MSDRIHVAPVEGRKLPRERMPRRYVDRAMYVPNSAYYRRAIRRGDIALVFEQLKDKSDGDNEHNSD